jgi:hypothetical protein
MSEDREASASSNLASSARQLYPGHRAAEPAKRRSRASPETVATGGSFPGS